MLDAKTDNGDNNWETIEMALKNAGGIGTLVLHSNSNWHQQEVKRLEAMGWHVYRITSYNVCYTKLLRIS